MAPVVQQIIDPKGLGEGPHWDHTENVLYFVSILDKTIHKYAPATGRLTNSTLEAPPHFILPVEGKKNHFLISQNRKVVEIEWSGEEGAAKILRTIAEVDQENPDNKFNDAKADSRGRLFAGTMGPKIDPTVNTSALYRIDADGSAHKLASDINLSNGLCWDLKEKAFYYADSLEFVIRKYDYNVETGIISNQRNVFSTKEHNVEGFVDGMTIDTDGNLWVAIFGGSQVLNIDPRTGKILQKIPIPAKQVTSVAFGGPNLDELYVTSACINYEEEQPPAAGATFRVTGLNTRGYPGVNVKIN